MMQITNIYKYNTKSFWILQLVYSFFFFQFLYYTKRLEGYDREKFIYTHAFVFCRLLEPLERNRESPEYPSKELLRFTSGDTEEIVLG